MNWAIPLLLMSLAISCKQESVGNMLTTEIETNGPSIVVLGTIQDAGSPHIGCKKDCCRDLFDNPDPSRKVVSLGLIDGKSTFLFEATPDISTQLKMLRRLAGSDSEMPDGIFLTHAHIGHYTGLMYLGKEATNAQKVPVYAMPRMKSYLETNGPWSQLVGLENIEIRKLEHREKINLSKRTEVVPFTVPHRDEFSETVGYFIESYGTKVLFIPDIDKWEKWETSIVEAVEEMDYLFLDATFYSGEEINTRDISEIPHPLSLKVWLRSIPCLLQKRKKYILYILTIPTRYWTAIVLHTGR